MKKTVLASEILRPEVAERRRVWAETIQPDADNMLERLVFIDETSLKTNLVKTTRAEPVPQRITPCRGECRTITCRDGTPIAT